MRTMTKNRAEREQQEKVTKRMIAYQKQMERTMKRKLSNHHMIRKG